MDVRSNARYLVDVVSDENRGPEQRRRTTVRRWLIRHGYAAAATAARGGDSHRKRQP
jgi:hypothetical protein